MERKINCNATYAPIVQKLKGALDHAQEVADTAQGIINGATKQEKRNAKADELVNDLFKNVKVEL